MALPHRPGTRSSPRRIPRRWNPRRHGGDRGAVTVEAALALGCLAATTALAIAAIASVGASVRCTDAARELARAAARGEPEHGRAVAARLAPPGARIVLTVRGDEATAEVTVAPVSALPVRVSGRAVAVLEPGVAADAAPAPPEGTPP
jgi:Flp pilus assembly protein TadG